MHSIAWWPTVFVVIVASITDICSRRIPNWLVLPFLAAGLVVSVAVGGWKGAERSILGILLAVALMGGLYWLGGMGMGDVKLCAAIGAWVGPIQLLMALTAMGMVGGVMAFFWALGKGSLKASFGGAADLLFGVWRRGLRPHPTLVLANREAQKMPYAPAIAAGAILSFLAQG
ncbi:MAG TPA: prepilin peptidase [Bryobacteraceae bacterium]|jgi:prepilin peptidase CpaA